MMKYVQIKGTGSYLPPDILTNADWAKKVDTSDEWIVSRTGIHTRHRVSEDDVPASMGEVAARRALESAGISADEIGIIIVSTAGPQYFFPSTACLIQSRLGIKGCPAFDINAACSGFLYGLNIATQYLKTGVARYALVISTEAMTKLADWTDRSTCVLFGDGAGAVVLELGEKPGIIACEVHADGHNAENILYMPTKLYQKKGETLPTYLTMKGRELFKMAVEKMKASVLSVLERYGVAASEIDWVIPHQANIRIMDSLVERLGLPTSKIIKTISEHGNTSSASIPLAFDLAITDGRIKRGQLVLFEAFGGGLTWGTVLLRY